MTAPPLPVPPPPGSTETVPPGESLRALLSLWLSLMLILLAVFIVLGADSRPRADRSRAALASIAAVFGDGPLDRPPADDARRRSAAAVVEALAIELLAEAPPGGYRFTPDSNLKARVLIPVEAFFETARDDVDDDANPRLDRIAAAAGALPAGYRLGLVVTLPASPHAGASRADPPVAAARGVALAEALERRGLPADRLAIGIDDDAGNAVIFDFTADPGR